MARKFQLKNFSIKRFEAVCSGFRTGLILFLLLLIFSSCNSDKENQLQKSNSVTTSKTENNKTFKSNSDAQKEIETEKIKETDSYDDETVNAILAEFDYYEIYKKFLIEYRNDEEDTFVFTHALLMDINFDDIPELAILHDSDGSMGAYLKYYTFDGEKIIRIQKDNEPSKLSVYARPLVNFENSEIFFVQRLYLISGNDNGKLSRTIKVKEKDNIPFLETYLELTVDDGKVYKDGSMKNFENHHAYEDDFLLDSEYDDYLIKKEFINSEWVEITSREYLNKKRELIPRDDDFTDFFNFDIMTNNIYGDDLWEYYYRNRTEPKNFTSDDAELLFVKWKLHYIDKDSSAKEEN